MAWRVSSQSNLSLDSPSAMVLLGASSFRRLEQRQMHLSWQAGVTPMGQVEGLGQPRQLPPSPVRKQELLPE